MDEPDRILVVDDDADIRELLTQYLCKHGLRASAVADGRQMRAFLADHGVDLIVLDLMLPGTDGLALCRELRSGAQYIPVVMLTARGDEADRILGLEMGADDYLAKPFAARELLARVKSVLRRVQSRPAAEAVNATAPTAAPAPAPSPSRQRFGRCELDVDSRRLFEAGGDEIAMTAMEFDLLRVFLANPNRVLSRDQLLVHTRNREWEPFDRSIDIRIGRLRRKVEPDPAGEPRCIRTVRNAGYMYVPGL